MHLIGDQGIGIFLLAILTMQGGAMVICTGRFLQIKSEGKGIVLAENYFNTTILILFIPLIAVSLIFGWYRTFDLSHLTITLSWLVYGLEAIGIALIVSGTTMVVLGFLALRKTFQPGGFAPRSQDQLITSGIYALVRNPLNSGVLHATMGLALVIQSFFVIALFIIYLNLVLRVISIEENQLFEAFGEEYRSYHQKVRRLVPFIY
jgi:protein-S-isoprenylcysteine O-methyltransferase Ste14